MVPIWPGFAPTGQIFMPWTWICLNELRDRVPIALVNNSFVSGHRLQSRRYSANIIGPSRAIFVSPSHQYPMAVALSMSRRLPLLPWPQPAAACILEDHFQNEFDTTCP